MKIRNVCYILGAMDVEKIHIERTDGDFVIAADAGVRHLAPLALDADLTVGDFDSLGHLPEFRNVIVHPVEKDDTDTMLAVKEGLARGYRRFVILGALGGRLDQTLASLQTLAYLAIHGAEGYLLGDGKVVTLLSEETVVFDPSYQGVLSLFCVGDRATVTIEGLKYPLHDYLMTCDYPIGVSNEFMGTDSRITVKKGRVWMILDAEDQTVENLISVRMNYREEKENDK
ncbi:MAG: thiamine diphosphokinase [Eubacteriales bacterium]